MIEIFLVAGTLGKIRMSACKKGKEWCMLKETLIFLFGEELQNAIKRAREVIVKGGKFGIQWKVYQIMV